MSEADWWLCSRCQSLNSLSARKCYSCWAKKPKNAVRASQVLGYRAIESWDGKVKLEEGPVLAAPVEGARPKPPPKPPPLRDPAPRAVVAVAPRPPQGARITYVHSTPPAAPAPPRLAVAVGPGRPPVEPAAVGAGKPSVVADAPPDVAGQTREWPHWRALLEGPAPDGVRLRAAYAELPDAQGDMTLPSERSGSLSRAISTALADRSGPKPAWPDADLQAPSSNGGSAGGSAEAG